MWIICFLFLFLPLLSLQEFSDRLPDHTTDYHMQQISPEMARFAAYTDAVRLKLSKTKRDSEDFTESWTDETLDDFKPAPHLLFPSSVHGNCRTEEQTISVKRTTMDTPEEKHAYFRLAWITPNARDWKKYAKFFNERYFGIYEDGVITTKGNWANIELCGGIANNSLIFAVEQER